MKFTYLKSAVFFFVLIWSFQLSAQVGVEYIWGGPNSTGTEYDNSTFNGGLNDWTTEGLESATQDSAANAVWRWDENGTMATGAYWGPAGTIESPTVANGAVGFDSDGYDNVGSAPSPQKSTLTSPSMDCTGEAKVSVMFYESYRNYNSSTRVEVSNDGGNTWVPYAISYNDDVPGNQSTGGDGWTYVNISATAANQADVRIRFVWDGDYYYWLVDDVALIKSPQNDLSISDYLYPASSYTKSVYTDDSCDSLNFACVIRNVAEVTRSNIKVYASVSDMNGVIFVDSVALDELSGDADDSLILFDNSFGEATSSMLPTDYTFRYFLSDGEQDFNPSDNSRGGDYKILTNTLTKGPQVGRYPYPATNITSFFAEGAFYRLCDLNLTDIELGVDAVGFAVNTQDQVAGSTVEIWIKKVIDPDFKYPEVTMSSSMDENDGIGWETKGYAEFSFESEDQKDTMIWITQFTNLLGDELSEIVLDPNFEYLALVETSTNNNSTNLAIGFSPNMHYRMVHGGLVYGTSGGIILQDPGGVYGGWNGSTGDPQVALKVRIIVDSKLPQLPENTIKIMPNPVQDQLNLKLEFAEPTDVSYALATMTGSLLQLGRWQHAKNETQHLDVSNLSNGQYLVRIQTKDGVATKSFTIAK